jgi:hypothetical protein
MKMYSQNRRGKEWGPYEIPVYNAREAPNIGFTCKVDEAICIGAWSADGMQWGVGEGQQSCSECCVRCETGYRLSFDWIMKENGRYLIYRLPE